LRTVNCLGKREIEDQRKGGFLEKGLRTVTGTKKDVMQRSENERQGKVSAGNNLRKDERGEKKKDQKSKKKSKNNGYSQQNGRTTTSSLLVGNAEKKKCRTRE